MSNEEFVLILNKAVNGSAEDIGIIIELYMPLIKKMSYVDGALDEDMRQCLMMHVFRNIHKFTIEDLQ